MTDKWLPQTGIVYNSADIVNMWYKRGYNLVGGLGVTFVDSGIEINTGYAQVDGSAVESKDQTFFSLDFLDNVTYFLFLVSNRTNDIITSWSVDGDILLFPDNIVDYDNIEGVPAMSTKLALGYVVDKATTTPTDTSKLLEGLIQNTRGLFIQPIWSSRNGAYYYYPVNYDYVDVMYNIHRSVVGLDTGDFTIHNFSSVDIDSTLYDKGDGSTDIQLSVNLRSGGGVAYQNIHLDGVNISAVSGTTITIPIPVGTNSCQINAQLTKFGKYIFVYAEVRWNTGELNIIAGQLYYLDNTVIEGISITYAAGGTESGCDIMSDMKIRVR